MDTGLSLQELSAWLGVQLESWSAWGDRQDASWLGLPTNNERHPALGQMFIHAFSPLRRYADQALGALPADDSGLDPVNWQQLRQWAHDCHARHAEVLARFTAEDADLIVEYRTRSAGVLRVSAREALFHAGTHCFWHLGGIAHLLRREGIAPPQRSDLIFWATTRHG